MNDALDDKIEERPDEEVPPVDASDPLSCSVLDMVETRVDLTQLTLFEIVRRAHVLLQFANLRTDSEFVLGERRILDTARRSSDSCPLALELRPKVRCLPFRPDQMEPPFARQKLRGPSVHTDP
jgi:hypothetical protein